MRLTCTVHDLQRVLSAVGPIVPRRPWQPAMAYLKLVAQDGGLSVTAIDTDRWMVGSMAADVGAPGQALLPGHVLCDLVAQLPDGELEMTQQGPALELRSGGWCARLNGEPELEFPDLTQPAGDCSRWEMLGAYLHMLVQRTAFAADQDPSRPVLTGIHLSPVDGTLEAAATNGHVLAVAQARLRDGFLPSGVTVPATGLRQVARLAQAEDVVAFEVDQAWMRATLPGYTFGTRLLAGHYPSYRRLLPDTFALVATVPRQELRQALQRARVLADEDHRRVVLDFAADGLVLSAREAEYGEVQERIPCELEGQGSMQLCLNRRYLVAALASMSGDAVLVKLNRPDAPVILGEPGIPHQVLIMPILLKP